MTVPTSDDQSIRDIVAETLRAHPVSVGYLFGSFARGEAHDRSDIDVAVVFENGASGLPTKLALGADLALALGTDDVDVVDLESAPPSLIRTIFREGDRLIGNTTDERRFRNNVRMGTEDEQRSPAERFDDALATIDDHLA